MTTITATVTVNAAFLQEIKEVNQELWQLLGIVRNICNRPLPLAVDGRRLVALLEELRDQIALHFALEEAYGYFEDPTDANPHLCRSADRLRSQHRELYLEVCRLAERADKLHYTGHLPSMIVSVASAFHAFDRRFQVHESEENGLIQEAYDDDIGAGD